MTDERRKNYHEKLGGMSTGTIVSMFTVIVMIVTGSGFIYTTRAIAEEAKNQIQEVKTDVSERLIRIENNQREDSREQNRKLDEVTRMLLLIHKGKPNAKN